jgi:hypothetical protein
MILQAFPKLNENYNQDTSLFKVQMGISAMISANYSRKYQCKIQKRKFWRGNPEKIEFQADLIPYGVLSQLQFCYPNKEKPSTRYTKASGNAA